VVLIVIVNLHNWERRCVWKVPKTRIWWTHFRRTEWNFPQADL